MFFLSISALWGWYFLDLAYCAILIASAYDKRKYLRNVILKNGAITKEERHAVLFFTTLLAISVSFNLVFIALYFIGVYVPPFRFK
jgi:hypothetical protein